MSYVHRASSLSLSLCLSVCLSVCLSLSLSLCIFILLFYFCRLFIIVFYTPPHDSAGVLWFHAGRPCVRTSVRQSYVRPSVFRFRMITSNISGFSPSLVCALILWRSGLGLLMGKFRQFFITELSTRDTIMAGYYSLTFLFFYLFIYFWFSFLILLLNSFISG